MFKKIIKTNSYRGSRRSGGSDVSAGSSRIHWVDTAKAISIFCIVFGHTIRDDSMAGNFIFSFNTAVFFMLSGYTFRGDRRSSGSFIVNALKKIMLPFYFWSIVSIVIYPIAGQGITGSLGNRASASVNNSLTGNLMGMLYANSETGLMNWNRPLWFLPCLFCIECIWFAVLKLTEKTIAIGKSLSGKHQNTVVDCTAASVILLSFAFMYYITYSHSNFIWPLESETALSMCSYFGIGLMLRRIPEQYPGLIFGTRTFLNKITKGRACIKTVMLAALAGVLFAFVIILSHYAGHMDSRPDDFNNVTAYILCSLAGSAAIILISRAVGKFLPFEYVGRRTLAILVLHKFPLYIIEILSPSVHALIRKDYLPVCIAVDIVIVLLCLAVEKLLRRFAPITIGAK